MAKAQRQWSADEDVVLRDLWHSGKRKKAIGTRLDRTESSVSSRLRVLGIIPKQGDKAFAIERDFEAARAHNAECDRTFRRAMQAALDSGLEHWPVDVPQPAKFRPHFFASPMVMSGCGSSAGECADLGTDTGSRRFYLRSA